MIEQEMPMTGASMFWRDALHGCNLDRSLPLPYDRYRLSGEHRSGRGTTVSFDFGQDLSHTFLAHASSNNINPQHLVLASYYVFLFKLTNGEQDICIGMNTHGRYKEELMRVIGMFVNAIPLRCQLDPYWSFHQLVQCVAEMMKNSMEYSYFPLQRILAQHSNTAKPTFLDTSFVFGSYLDQKNAVMVGHTQLERRSATIEISEDEIMSKFDFDLTVQHNLSTNQLSCKINASLDLFNVETIDKIAQRFHRTLEGLINGTEVDMKKPICELSLVLPDESASIQSMNNTQVLFPPVSCIHHEFVGQALKYSQKLAVELDDQSLTYSELLYYAQLLALDLLENHSTRAGEIVCQCVERSLSMVCC